MLSVNRLEWIRAHGYKFRQLVLLLVLMIVVLERNVIIAHGLINYDAILSVRHLRRDDCAHVIDREVRFGQRALDANVPELARYYLDRALFMSGWLTCSSDSPHWDSRLAAEDEWGRFVVVENELAQQDLHVWLSMWAWANKWRLVKSVANASIERHPDRLFAYYYLAQAWLQEGNAQVALDVYLSAFDLFPDSALLCREVARIYHDQLGQTEKALQWYAQALKLDAKEATARLACQRLTSVDVQSPAAKQVCQAEVTGWAYDVTVTQWDGQSPVLYGYTLDEDLYELSQGVDIEWYGFWRNPQDVRTAPGQFQVGEWWVIRTRTQNLVPNARFVWDQEARPSVLPRGYLDVSWEGTTLSDHALVNDQRDGQALVCAQLLNEVWDRTGFYTLPIPIHSDTCYLQASWLKGVKGAQAYVGYEWLGDEAWEPGQVYSVAQTQPLDWTHYAGTVISPPGAHSVRLHLLNNLPGGPTCFHDVMFVPIECK